MIEPRDDLERRILEAAGGPSTAANCAEPNAPEHPCHHGRIVQKGGCDRRTVVECQGRGETMKLSLYSCKHNCEGPQCK